MVRIKNKREILQIVCACIYFIASLSLIFGLVYVSNAFTDKGINIDFSMDNNTRNAVSDMMHLANASINRNDYTEYDTSSCLLDSGNQVFICKNE